MSRALIGVVLALAVSTSGCNELPKTPPTPTLDKNQFINNCMTYGEERVGECMKYLSWEA